MADEVFATRRTFAPASGMARFSVEDTSMKQDSDALLKFSQVLYGLVGSLVNSLEEFGDVVNTLEVAAAAGIVNGSLDDPQTSERVEARPELLVAATLKEMVVTWVSNIKANAGVQKLLSAIQKSGGANHRALFQDLTISKPASPSTEETLVCISSKDSRTAKRVAVKGQVICKHSSEGHPELVDPWLWRKLPQDLVELVFAKLPLPQIIDLYECSKAWSAMLKSFNFRQACS